MTESLLGLAEIAELYSVHKQTAATWTRRRDFPHPAHTFAMGPCWRREDVLAWRPISSESREIIYVPSTCPRCADSNIVRSYEEHPIDMYGVCGRCGARVIILLAAGQLGRIETIIKEIE